jgi:hypothetical protein
VHHVYARHRNEHRGKEVLRAAVARRRVVDLAGLLLCENDELFHRIHVERWMHRQCVGLRADFHDRLEILHGIVGGFLVYVRHDDVRRTGREQRVTVGARMRRDLGADQPTRTSAVIHDHLLPEQCRQPCRDDSHDRVGCAAGTERHDHAHRLHRILLRVRKRPREQKQSCKEKTAGSMPQFSLHRDPPRVIERRQVLTPAYCRK